MNDPRILYQFRINEDAARILDALPSLIEEVNSLSRQHRARLRYSIRDLWRLLTMEKAQRTSEYLSEPEFFLHICDIYALESCEAYRPSHGSAT